MASVLASVLFTDIVGSTEMRSRLGDDEVDRVVARHDSAVARAVGDAGGRVIKYLGDGALAVFDSASSAVRAARDILDALTDGPAIRLGIHAGDVEEVDDDVAGLPVSVASRLCGAAPAGDILVSGLVRSLAGSRGGFEFEFVGRPALKGVDEAVEAWRVVDRASPIAAGTPLALPTIGRMPAHFVGRERALGQLDEALAGRTRQYLVAVSGEPGIGKTALVGEWARRTHDAGSTVLVGASPPEGVAPYQPFIEALRPLLRNDPSIHPTGSGAGNLARVLPELASRSVPPPLLDDPRSERFVLNEAFVEVLALATERHGRLVLVLDDLHWADEASIVLLGHLLRHRDDLPLLVIGTYRDTDLDRRHPLADLLRDQRRERRAERLDLSGLERSDVGRLVSAIAGGEAPEDALAVILRETEGNPFFVAEVTEHLVAERKIVDGAWDFDASAPMAIPEGVRDTIGRRVDHLSEAARDVLAAAAVTGAIVDPEVLVAVAATTWEVAESAVEEAVSAGLIVESGGGELAFSHALIRQAVLDDISVLRRSRLHRRAGEALEAADAPPDRLVMHWIEARDPARALVASLRAMRDAEAVAAQSAVIQHAERALELWDDVDSDERPERFERHDPILAAGLAIAISRGSEEGVSYLRGHRSGLEAAGDELGTGVVLAEEARHLWTLGRVEEALAQVERALELIPPRPTPERARAEAQLGRLLMLGGSDVKRAADVTHQAVETAQAAGDPLTEAAAMITLGIVVDDPDEGETILRKGLEMATAQNAAFQVTRARSNLSELLSAQAKYDEAIEMMAEGLGLATRLGIEGQSLGWMRVNLGEKYLDAARWDEALEVLVDEAPYGYPEAMRLQLTATLAAHQGRFDDARRSLAIQEERYGHITDIQYRSPAAATRLWLARWTGDVDLLPASALDVVHVRDDLTAASANAIAFYLVAGIELATIEAAPITSELIDDWSHAAEAVVIEPIGSATRATVRAGRLRYEGRDDPAAWREAVSLWPSDSFEYAICVLGWAGSGAAVEGELRDALDRAVATATRLGAAPLLSELRTVGEG